MTISHPVSHTSYPYLGRYATQDLAQVDAQVDTSDRTVITPRIALPFMCHVSSHPEHFPSAMPLYSTKHPLVKWLLPCISSRSEPLGGSHELRRGTPTRARTVARWQHSKSAVRLLVNADVVRQDSQKVEPRLNPSESPLRGCEILDIAKTSFEEPWLVSVAIDTQTRKRTDVSNKDSTQVAEKAGSWHQSANNQHHKQRHRPRWDMMGANHEIGIRSKGSDGLHPQ